MKKEEVEIYSDTKNFTVIRYPGREFPGSQIQGDSLHSLLQILKEAKAEVDYGYGQDASEILKDVIDTLSHRLQLFKDVLKEHGCELLFVE